MKSEKSSEIHYKKLGDEQLSLFQVLLSNISYYVMVEDKDNVVAEYSLEEVSQPIGIAGYELSNALSKEYQRSLPTIKTLETEVAKMMDTK